MAEIQTPVLYPAVQYFLSGLAAGGGPPLHELSPQEAREVLGGVQSGPIAKLPVDVTATRYLGITHDFVMLNALADTPAARGAIAQAVGALRQASVR
jgi:acetyl esterase